MSLTPCTTLYTDDCLRNWISLESQKEEGEARGNIKREFIDHNFDKLLLFLLEGCISC